MKPILIVSNSEDIEHASYVEDVLRRRGEQVFRFDTDVYYKGGIAITFFGDGAGILERDKTRIEIGSIKSVWYRRPSMAFSDLTDKREREFAKNELQTLFNQLSISAPQALWVSRPHSILRAQLKQLQLETARRLGFEIPRTCITNSPEETRRFVSSIRKKCVYKTLYLPVMASENENGVYEAQGIGVPTSIIETEHLDQLKLLPRTGGIIQEYVDKDYELRVTVVGQTALAVRIDSQNNPTEMVARTGDSASSRMHLCNPINFPSQ